MTDADGLVQLGKLVAQHLADLFTPGRLWDELTRAVGRDGTSTGSGGSGGMPITTGPMSLQQDIRRDLADLWNERVDTADRYCRSEHITTVSEGRARWDAETTAHRQAQRIAGWPTDLARYERRLDGYVHRARRLLGYERAEPMRGLTCDQDQCHATTVRTRDDLGGWTNRPAIWFVWDQVAGRITHIECVACDHRWPVIDTTQLRNLARTRHADHLRTPEGSSAESATVHGG